MKLNELRDNDGATHSQACVSAAASARARARPAVAASRARRRAPASPSTASKAARCRSTGACRSAASTTSSPRASTSCRWPASRPRIDAGKLDAKATVDAEALIEAGVIRRVKDGVRLLADGEIKAKLAFDVAGASKAAIEKIEKAGGSVKLPEQAAAE